MGIAACIIRAVAVEEMGAGRHTIVRRLVGKVAAIPFDAGSGADERLADGDLACVVAEAAFIGVGTNTCEHVRDGQGCLPTDDVSLEVGPVCRGWLDDVISIKYRSWCSAGIARLACLQACEGISSVRSPLAEGSDILGRHVFDFVPEKIPILRAAEFDTGYKGRARCLER